LVDGSRTPYLKARGRPGPFSASDLAVAAGRPLLARQRFSAEALDEVVLGCVMPGPDEANIARVAALRLGCGKRMPAWTVQRNCASGMQAIDSAACNIAAGRADLVLAGGVEAMSHAPVTLSETMVAWLAEWQRARSIGARFAALSSLRPVHLKPVIALMRGLRDPVTGLSMGQTAENLAQRFEIAREQMDAFALESHRRLAAAQEEKRLTEIEPLFSREGEVFEHDDGLRRDSSMEQLAALEPAFDRGFGSVTAGNSAQVTDGAAWVVLASDDAVKQYGLTPMARIVDSEWAGLDPAQMGLGPVYASTPILQRQHLGLGDVDYWEINEAFAAQVLACLAAWENAQFCSDELGLEKPLGNIDRSRLNVDGGGVSLGHPVGSSGARIVLHLAYVLTANNARRGIATSCIGGGQGGAMLIERDTG
jgi:acetyl-CoA C-acetyltransferase